MRQFALYVVRVSAIDEAERADAVIGGALFCVRAGAVRASCSGQFAEWQGADAGHERRRRLSCSHVWKASFGQSLNDNTQTYRRKQDILFCR
jgi:hypothetical protein